MTAAPHPSAPRGLRIERAARALLADVQARADRSAAGRFGFEFLMFGLKQAWACLFGAALLALLLLTHLAWPAYAPLARYDALVLAAVALQALMLATRLETLGEAKVILVFHVIGTAMEVFKTHVGSWTYPEPSLLRIGGVPLFSGFMYASVGSYLARAWRLLDVRFSGYPPAWTTWALAAAIYVNFFSHHFVVDLRYALFVVTALLFVRARVFYRPDRRDRAMPVLLSFLLVALFIWFAENLATFSHAWIYPAQRLAWRPVQPEKLGSWLLLLIISWVLVASVQGVRAPEPAPTRVPRRRPGAARPAGVL